MNGPARARALRPAIEGHRTHGQLLLAWLTMDGRSSFLLLREWRATVVDRRRVELIERGVPSQPYHHETLALGDDEAEQLLGKVRRSIAACTTLAFHRLAADSVSSVSSVCHYHSTTTACRLALNGCRGPRPITQCVAQMACSITRRSARPPVNETGR